ncbi:MAG: glycosyltransferase [Leptothrix sp. (in: b-proteobacteria)]
MRLMHVVDSLEFGGLERVVTDLAIAQKRRGHQVTVFSLLPTEGFLPELQAAGVDVVIGNKRRSADLAMILRMRRQIAERGIDIVHAHNFVPNYHAAAATLYMRRRPAQVCTCHDMGTRLSNPRLRRFFTWSLGHTVGVAMVGRQVYDRYVNDGLVPAEQAMTVLNGVPIDRFAWTPERRSAARKALGVSDDTLLIGAVGRLVALKNQRLLIEVLPALAKQHPSVKLVVIGGGPLEAELRALAEAQGVADRVMVLGQRTDVADLTPGFDIFAMPSLTEGLSIALLEACATRLAIVATAVGGNPEIIRDGQTGLLVPPSDGPALQAALAKLLDERGQREQLAQAACDWVRQNASLDSLCDAYDRFYEQSIATAIRQAARR